MGGKMGDGRWLQKCTEGSYRKQLSPAEAFTGREQTPLYLLSPATSAGSLAGGGRGRSLTWGPCIAAGYAARLGVFSPLQGDG